MKNLPKNKFYVTTTIYYINDKPHIGHAYTNIAADVLARYYRKKIGKQNVLFSTGTDENSKKTIEAAKEAGKEIQKYIDDSAKVWKTTWQKLDIEFNDFIRTTEERHAISVQHFISQIYKNNSDDIYKGVYEGKYCFRCETFYKDDELVDGLCCPVHKKPVENIKEENYFFKLSKYQDRLKQYILDNPDFIQPQSRKNEVLAFIERGLEDISISRANQSIGIELPFDKSQKTYVWVDALVNYLTVAGYPKKGYEEWWSNVHHIIGKDIIKFHCIIWPALLMSAGVQPPRQVFAHGFFTINDEKISKSLGNAIDPVELAQKYGNDALRYFLLREITFGADGDFSMQRFHDVYHSDLANNLGNLVSRLATMLTKYNDATYQPAKVAYDFEIEDDMQGLAFHSALATLFSRLDGLNTAIEDNKPWELFKKDPAKTAEVLNSITAELLLVTQYLEPFLPETTKKIQKVFNKDGKVDAAVGILFPRIED